jgi:hypothetical protein
MNRILGYYITLSIKKQAPLNKPYFTHFFFYITLEFEEGEGCLNVGDRKADRDSATYQFVAL